MGSNLVEIRGRILLDGFGKICHDRTQSPLMRSIHGEHLDDMEATITRQGYGLRELVQNFDAKPAEIKALFANQLDPVRASELLDRMRLAGLPI